jgi:hypothetical protein
MPETSLILDREDENHLISAIFREGGRLVRDIHPTSEYQEITTWDEFESARTEQRKFYLLHSSFQLRPLQLSCCNGGYYDGKFFVDQRYGGPTIDLALCTEYEKEDKTCISQGFIGYYPSYYLSKHEEIKAPQALIALFKSLVSEIRGEGTVIRSSSGRKYLIGPHTASRIKAGRLHVGIHGLDIHSDAL